MAMSDNEIVSRPSRLQFRASSDTENGRLIGHFNTYNRGDMNSPHVRLSKDIFPLSQKMNNSIEKIIKLKNKKDSSILDQEQPDIEHPKGKIMGKIKSVFSSNTDEELRKDIEKLRSDFYKLLNDKRLRKTYNKIKSCQTL